MEPMYRLSGCFSCLPPLRTLRLTRTHPIGSFNIQRFSSGIARPFHPTWIRRRPSSAIHPPTFLPPLPWPCSHSHTDGSPGVVANFQSSLPVFTSKAETISAKRRKLSVGVPIGTHRRAHANRHREGVGETSLSCGSRMAFGSGIAQVDHSGFPGRCVRACMRPSATGTRTFTSCGAIPRLLHTTTQAGFSGLRHGSIRLRVIAPDLFTGFRVDGRDDAPVRHGI